MTLWAVVPAKKLATAKGRLAPLLAQHERRALAGALLADVLVALRSAAEVQRTLVISADPVALALADSLGARPLREPAPPAESRAGEAPLNAALDYAAAVAEAAGVTALLALPADLPLLTPGDVVALTTPSLTTPAVVLAPTPDGGTSALLRRPPRAIPARFGAESLQAHLRAAAERGLQARLVWRPNLALDIDRPSDLLRLAAMEPRTRTQALLAEWRIAERWCRERGRTVLA